MQKMTRHFVLFAFALALGGCAAAVSTQQPEDAYILFETDGRGGLYFEDTLRTQAGYPGVTDTIVQGSANSVLFYILHYPQGFGDDADYAVAAFAKKVAGEYIFASTRGIPHDSFFSETHARLEVIAARAEGQAKQTAEESDQDEDWAFYENPVYPVYISYEITEAPEAFSVNFRLWSYTGGAHDNWIYRAITIDKSSGRAVDLKTLFVSPVALERTMYWLRTTAGAGYYYHGSCMTDEAPLERTNIDLQSRDMAEQGLAMERLIVTPQGLEVVFAPYEQGSFAMGDVRAPIPLEKFKRLGITPRYWQTADTRNK